MTKARGLFAGLNVLPKITYATDYSYKTERAMTERLIAAVIAKTPLGDPPLSFNLDFHAIPFRGDEPDLENHWVPMRNRALPAVMAFVAQAAGRRVICYATANVLRAEADAMVPKFADYWKEQTGQYPARLLFDSRATTYAGLNQLTQREVGFITIRRRGSGMLARVRTPARGRWRHCQITQAKGKRRQVHYVDEQVQLDGYEGDLRQLIVTGLGHESPTFFLTNDQPQAADGPRSHPDLREPESRREPPRGTDHVLPPRLLVQRRAAERGLRPDADGAGRPAVPRAWPSGLKGFARAGPSRLFRKFVDTPGTIEITAEGVIVRLSKRAHNPLLKEAGLTQADASRAVAGRSMRSHRVPLTAPALELAAATPGGWSRPPGEARGS